MSVKKTKKTTITLDKKTPSIRKVKREEPAPVVEEIPEDDDDMNSPEDPRVLRRYNQAAKITNDALAMAVGLCVPGAVVVDVCKQVDAFVAAEAKKAYTGKFLYESGIAFPCCISLNNCAGYYSPLSDDKTALKAGDVAKIELAAHVSGFVAEAATTVCVGEAAEGDKKRVIAAGYTALQDVIAKLQPGVNCSDITAAVQAVCKAHDVKAVETIVSRNMERYIIDGPKYIYNSDEKADDIVVEENDVWNLDIVLTTGPNHMVERDARTTVFKRNVDETYILKMKTSVMILRESNTKFPTFPFSLRQFDSESKAKMGIVEMAKHNLVEPYTVVFDKDGYVSQFKATVLVKKDGPVVLTPIAAPFPAEENKE